MPSDLLNVLYIVVAVVAVVVVVVVVVLFYVAAKYIQIFRGTSIRPRDLSVSCRGKMQREHR